MNAVNFDRDDSLLYNMKNPKASLILSRVDKLKEMDLSKLIGGTGVSSADDKVEEISIIYDPQSQQTKADVNGQCDSSTSRP